MTFEALITEHRDHRPGYDFIGHYEAAIPFYEIQIKVEVLRSVEMSTMAQFVVRLIHAGIQTEQRMAEALGVAPEFIQSALIELDQQGCLRRTFDAQQHGRLVFHLTKKGTTALTKTLTTATTEYFRIAVDGLLGDIVPHNRASFLDQRRLKQQGVFLLHPVPRMKPTIPRLIESIRQVEHAYRRGYNQVAAADHLVDVLSIEKTHLAYKLVNVLVFVEQTSNRLDFNVFEGYEAAPQYDAVFGQREREGHHVIPESLLVSLSDPGYSQIYTAIHDQLEPMITTVESRGGSQDHAVLRQERADDSLPSEIVTEKTQRIRDLEEEKQHLLSMISYRGVTRQVSNAEHRVLLIRALEEAQQRVTIISPWINSFSVDTPVLERIEQRLQHGIQIRIGFGMPLKSDETPDTYIKPDVAQRFRQLMSKPYGQHFVVQYLGTHEKILLCDHAFCVVTSFNFLSYTGTQGLRREKGIYTEDQSLITDISNDVMKLFRA